MPENAGSGRNPHRCAWYPATRSADCGRNCGYRSQYNRSQDPSNGATAGCILAQKPGAKNGNASRLPAKTLIIREARL